MYVIATLLNLFFLPRKNKEEPKSTIAMINYVKNAHFGEVVS